MVEWRFDNILLPDSGTNEAASHGLVSFRIRPVQPLLAGTTFSNAANIFFDFNDPVITEPSVLTAEFSTQVQQQLQGQVSLFPNPAKDILHILGIPSGEALSLIEIRANDGRVCRAIKTAGSDIRIEGLPPGSYLLVVYRTNGTRSVHSFTKY